MKVSRTDFKREEIADYDPDLSYLGEYSNEPGPKDKTIDREKRGDMRHGEFRYFIAAMSGKETGNRLSVGQDYKRMEAYNAGEWRMIGLRASVELQIPHGSHTITQTIKSPGLWGVESDSGASYFDEVYKEECATLEAMLIEMGTIEIVD